MSAQRRIRRHSGKRRRRQPSRVLLRSGGPAGPGSPERIDLDRSELESILERAKMAALSPAEYDTLHAAMETLIYLTQELEKNRVSVQRLKHLLFGTTTEKTQKVMEKILGEADKQNNSGDDAGESKDTEARQKAKGHGRNGTDTYTGADKVRVPHESLKGGDACPNCKKGNYSLGNAILIGFQKPDATRISGFRTWQKLGRYVRRNEKGIAIMAPIVWRKKVIHKGDERGVQEHDEETALAFKTAYVFDISQTDGKPLPAFARVNGDPGVYTERLREYITSKGIMFEYSDTIGSAEGVSSGGLIRLKKGLTAAEELAVLAHETAHEILHKNRDNMPKDKKVRETEAEAVAFVVCYGIGLDTNSASSDYIQLYNGDKETLMESLGRIQKTA